MTLLNPKKDDYLIYEIGVKHKFSATVTTFQDDVFYPMEVLSPNDVVVFEGDIKRGRFEQNETPDGGSAIQIIDVRNSYSFHNCYALFYFRHTNKAWAQHGFKVLQSS